jgi:hypothetical protein
MMNDLERAYQILRLEPNATLDKVEEAYRDAAWHWHPNHFPPEPHVQEKAQAKIREITAAYQQVKNFLWERESKKLEAASPAADEPWRITPGPAPPPPGKISSLAVAAQTWIREHTAPLLIGLVIVAGLFFSPLIYYYLNAPAKLAPAPVQEKVAALPAPGSQALPGDKAGSRIAAPSPGTAAGRSRTAPPVASRYFTLGSSPEEVRVIQGPPRYLSATTWKYGLSTVTFKNRRVVGYANISQNLRVSLAPKPPVVPAGLPVFFAVGSSKDRVLAVQGTPSMVVGNTWKYGESEVKFQGDRVVSFTNFADNLQVKGPGKAGAAIRTAKRGHRGYFTLGSSKRQVLAVQGPPTRVWGNTWWYGYSQVTFYDDRVIGFADASRNLKARVLYTQRH